MAEGRGALGAASSDQIFSPGAYQSGGRLPSSSAAPSASLSGSDLSSLVQMVSGATASSGITQDDITKALTPVSQAQPQGLPAYFQRQISDPPPVQLDRSQQVGAGNARGQGISNAISASVGALAQFKATRDRNKLEAEGTQVSRFLQAQEGLDQAKQVIAQGPNTPGYKEAQQTLQQNQTLMNGMLADPKFVKTMEKGFNISLTDPSQNKTPEHGIVQRGIDLFRQSKNQKQPYSPEQVQAIASKFQAARPQMLAPNQQAIQNLQMKQALVKDQIALQKAVLPALIREEGEKARSIETTKRTEYVQQQANRRTALTQGSENARAYAKILNDRDIEVSKENAKKGLAYLNFNLKVRAAEKIMSDKAATPAALQAEKFRVDHQMTATEQAQERTLASYANSRMSAISSGMKDTSYYDGKIKELQDTLDGMRKDHAIVLKQFDDEITGKVGVDGTGGSGNATPKPDGSASNVGGAASTGSLASSLANASSLEERLRIQGLTDTEDDDTGEDDEDAPQ